MGTKAKFTRKRHGQTDRRTDGRTDTNADTVLASLRFSYVIFTLMGVQDAGGSNYDSLKVAIRLII